MITDLSVLASSAADLVLATSSDEDGSSFGLLFLLSGVVFYVLVWLRYRNVDKRHHHERETRAEMHDLRSDDRLVGSVKGVSNRRMTGANNTEVRGARRGVQLGGG